MHALKTGEMLLRSTALEKERVLPKGKTFVLCQMDDGSDWVLKCLSHGDVADRKVSKVLDSAKACKAGTNDHNINPPSGEKKKESDVPLTRMRHKTSLTEGTAKLAEKTQIEEDTKQQQEASKKKLEDVEEKFRAQNEKLQQAAEALKEQQAELERLRREAQQRHEDEKAKDGDGDGGKGQDDKDRPENGKVEELKTEAEPKQEVATLPQNLKVQVNEKAEPAAKSGKLRFKSSKPKDRKDEHQSVASSEDETDRDTKPRAPAAEAALLESLTKDAV